VDATTTASLNSLDRQRAHVLGTLEGLDPEALRKPVLSSGWNCLGLVQHLTLDVERFWFTTVNAGESLKTPPNTPLPCWSSQAPWPLPYSIATDSRSRRQTRWSRQCLSTRHQSSGQISSESGAFPISAPSYSTSSRRQRAMQGTSDAVRELLDGRTRLIVW